MDNRRFRVGLSFPGEQHRPRIKRVADLLSAELGKDKVFFDEYWVHELARLRDSDLYLGEIYRQQCDLIVVFFCEGYEKSEWCSNVEWPVIRDILKDSDRDNAGIFPIRLDDADIKGLYSNEIYLEAANRSDEYIAEQVLKRLKTLDGEISIPEQEILPPALATLEQDVIANQHNLTVDQDLLQQVRTTKPESLRAYQLTRIADWAQPKYELDKRFTQLSLLMDMGEAAQDARFVKQKETFRDLRQVLATLPDATAFVLLGAPGSGKSTLLRRLEMDLTVKALLSGESNGLKAFYLSLAEYRGAQGKAAPSPAEWLDNQWTLRYPTLPPLASLLKKGTVVLLLDALNEMPHRDADHYDELTASWRDYIQSLARQRSNCRLIFSCRTIDYSALLSTAELNVPHIDIENMGPGQILEFLKHYAVVNGSETYDAEALFKEIEQRRQFELYRTPFYLKLLLEEVQSSGQIPKSRSGLFTAFVRRMLAREFQNRNLKVINKSLLFDRDLRRLAHLSKPGAIWADEFELPSYGPLFADLAHLAFRMQDSSFEGEASQISPKYGEALELLDEQRAELVLTAGTELGILDQDINADTVKFTHQLLQEYFAARAYLKRPDAAKVQVKWRVTDLAPEDQLEAVRERLPDYEPLPGPPASGWEETVKMAVEMAPEPQGLIQAISVVNLPLATEAAVAAEIELDKDFRNQLIEELRARRGDLAVDLRHRIAAAKALGKLGDPDFLPREGPFGQYIPPTVIDIPAGTYTIGADDSAYNDEKPAHRVEPGNYQLARYPVTNAEWQCFIDAGGYDDERWWQTTEAKEWRAGKSTGDGIKNEYRELQDDYAEDPAAFMKALRSRGMISTEMEAWESLLSETEERFEQRLKELVPQGRQTAPALWNDHRYNAELQPVVGVCWYEANAYCTWLSVQTGGRWRLPSEAEWEAAARGAAGHAYAYGDEFDITNCNALPTQIRATTPIGVFAGGETRSGLSDMSGNVWEWCQDRWHENYEGAPTDGSAWESGEDGRRVVRGGSWRDYPDYCRSAYRSRFDPDFRLNNIGFRLCCSSPIE